MDSRNRRETQTLKVGDVAPDFTLKTAKQEDWHLKDFRGKKKVVLAFVPFAFSNVCSIQLPSYEASLESLRDTNTEIVSISMDSPYALDAWSQSIHTTFPMLSDFYPQGKVVDAYGVRHLAGMAERALFVVDKEGVIQYIEVQHSPGELPDNKDLFEALREIQEEK